MISSESVVLPSGISVYMDEDNTNTHIQESPGCGQTCSLCVAALCNHLRGFAADVILETGIKPVSNLIPAYCHLFHFTEYGGVPLSTNTHTHTHTHTHHR